MEFNLSSYLDAVATRDDNLFIHLNIQYIKIFIKVRLVYSYFLPSGGKEFVDDRSNDRALSFSRNIALMQFKVNNEYIMAWNIGETYLNTKDQSLIFRK